MQRDASDFPEPADPFEPILDHTEVMSRYSLCLAGFTLLAAGMMLRGIDVGLHLWIFLTLGLRMIGVFDQDWYFWMVRGAWVVAQVAGPFLLWGRWPHRRWATLTGILLGAGLLDLGLWIADSQERGGQLAPGLGEHHWLRLHLARAASWLQVGAGVGLASTFLDHLGRHQEARRAERIRGFLVAGVALWLFYFVRETAWDHGWPLVQWGLDDLGRLLLMAYFLPLSLSAVQLMVIDMIAAREANRLIADWRSHQLHHGTELLRSPSDLADFPAGPGSA
ncbi:MAG: hypothetical protein U0800_01325 [Isosphaeraceae bacterium]